MNTRRTLAALASVTGIALSVGILIAACSSSSSTPTPTQQTNGTYPTPTATGTATPATASVSIPQGAMGMGPAAYGTNPLVVAVGTTITWTNNDTMAHTVTSDGNLFDSGVMASGATFSFTFNTAGEFPYHCTIHGAASMSGMVNVH